MTRMVMTLQADDGPEQTLTDWSIDPDVILTRRHRAADTLQFKMTVADGTADPVFAVDSRIVLRKDVPYNDGDILGEGTVWFVGRLIEIPTSLGPGGDTHGYTAVGPWWDLEQIRFQQQWFAWDGGIDGNGHATPTFISKDTTHVILPWKNVAGGAVLLNINQQVEEAINYAITRSELLIALGTVDLIRTVAQDGFDAFTVALNEHRDISVAEVITNMLKWVSDAVVWWDYSNVVMGVPKPKFHCKSWKRLAETTLDLRDGTKVNGQIVPRYDLQVAGVVCRFEKANEADGETILVLTEQVYPPGTNSAGVGVMVTTIDLNGAKLSYSKAEVECPTIDAFSTNPATRLAWWKDRIPWLKTNYIRNIAVDVATRNGLLNLPRELKTGVLPEWMDVDSEEETIKAEIRYEKWSAEVGGEKQADVGLNGATPQVITFDLTSTDAQTGNYSDVKDNQPGEPEPENLARFLYDVASVLHWSGTVEDVRQTILGTVGIGQRLNLTGGRAAWATMKAMITTVTERPHQGTTVIEFGPPDRLGVHDLLELHRVNRRERWRWTPSGGAAGGKFNGGGGIHLGKRTPTKNSNTGPITTDSPPVWV